MVTVRGVFALVVLAAVVATTSAVFAEKKARPEPEDANAWQNQSLDLGDTGFVAAVGPWGTKHPVHYSVAVHRRLPGGAEAVYFDARVKAATLPKGFVKKSIKEIVTFDPASRLVRFDLGGGQEARFILPPDERPGAGNNKREAATAAPAPPAVPSASREPEFKPFNRLPVGWNLAQTKAFLATEGFTFDEEPQGGNGYLQASKYIGPEDTYHYVRIEFKGGYSVHVLESATDD